MILWTLSMRASQAWKKIQWRRKEGNPAGLFHQDAERMMDCTMWPKTAIQSAGFNASTIWDHTPRRQKQRREIRQTRKGLLIPTVRNLDYFWTRQNSHVEKSFSLIFLREPYLRHWWLKFCNPLKKNFFLIWPYCTAYRIILRRPGIEPVPPALEAWNLNHWTTREAPNP